MNTDDLKRWFSENSNQYVDLVFAGRIFGGRHGESMQQPRDYEFDGCILRMQFGTTEQMTVDRPSGFRRGRHGTLIIPRAARAVFGWHYYGRDQTPENWCEETYEPDGDQVKLIRTGPLQPGAEEFEYTGNRFVELS